MNPDILILGAGPSGTAAAAVLAEHGHRVLVLERESFPRYCVGESLIPFTYEPLERIGMIPKMRASGFQRKYSVQFVQPDGKASQPFYFFNRYDRDTIAQTWQVTRAEFDVMMRDNALEKGAQVRHGVTIKRLLKEGDRITGVEVINEHGEPEEIRAALTLDGTGRTAFAANQLGWRLPDPYLNKLAVWTYYKGSRREPGLDEGQTTVAMIPHKGWFWHIPQQDDMVSVGVVAEAKYLTRDGVKDPKTMFHREVEENLWIKEHLSHGEGTGQYWVTSEYSRHSKHCAMPGLLLLGDAFAFLDPVFSSGVMLAVKSGVIAGDAIHAGLLAGDLSPARFADYGAQMRVGVENMRKLVYAFYDESFSFKDVIMKHPEAAGLITDCLSGDVNRDFSQLWQWIGEFAPLPDNLPYGTPLVA